MIFLTNVYKDITSDFEKEQYKDSNILSRRFTFKDDVIILVSVYRKNLICEISVSIPNEVSVETLNAMPKWKGMEEEICLIFDKGIKKNFLSFKQIEDYERKIFFLVMQDIVDALKECGKQKVMTRIKEVLIKWNTFFQFDKNYILSNNVQQGLYGELYFLEKLISLKGEKALDCWTGCNAETHDFYCGKDAIEVKSSSAKGPNRINISNEYQLDDTGVIGKLYLLYLKMKKSEVDGETLPTIVERISDMLSSDYMLSFNEKLLKTGYIYQMPELYTVHFKIREENCYEVMEGFPRITTKTISKGISSVNYVVSLDACNSFQITIESFYEGVDL